MPAVPLNVCDRAIAEPVDTDDLWCAHRPFIDYLVPLTCPKTILDIGLVQRHSIAAFSNAMKATSRRYGSITGIRPVLDCETVRQQGIRTAPGYAPDTQILAARLDKAADQIPDESIDIIHIDGCQNAAALNDVLSLFVPKLSDVGVVLIHQIARLDGAGGLWRSWRDLSADRPHLTLPHAAGLGVLGLGYEALEKFSVLFPQSLDKRITLANRFSRLGQDAL